MKFSTATTIFFATLAIASPAPAPIAQPEAVAAVDSPNMVREAAPESILTADIVEIEARTPKKSKGGKSGGGGNDTNAAITITPSRALELAALSLGVMEVVRLWG